MALQIPNEVYNAQYHSRFRLCSGCNTDDGRFCQRSVYAQHAQAAPQGLHDEDRQAPRWPWPLGHEEDARLPLSDPQSLVSPVDASQPGFYMESQRYCSLSGEETSMKIAHITFLAAAIGAAAIASQPASAMPIATLQAPAQSSDVIQVHDGHGHGGHWHHHFGHQWHGGDHYYDNDDDSGVLFKSFVTGTLFSHTSSGDYSDHAAACAARYRSYNAADNSYVAANGARRQCR